tara:strand:- start:158 stop:1273 length:1116 start_codon:yes stop_codon:yes gene_type:complete
MLNNKLNQKYIIGIDYNVINIFINNQQFMQSEIAPKKIKSNIKKNLGKSNNTPSQKIYGSNEKLQENPLNSFYKTTNNNIDIGECLKDKACFNDEHKTIIINELNNKDKLNIDGHTGGRGTASRLDPPLTQPYTLNNFNNNIKEIKEKFSCFSQKCIGKKLNLNLNNFKNDGPANTTELLSNVDIDSFLLLLQNNYTNFHTFNFTMNDWHNNKGNSEIIKLANDKTYICNLFKNNKNCIGFVQNTDDWNGNGIHWTAIFIDLRENDDWNVEFFNSSGNKPSRNINNLINCIINNLYSCNLKPAVCNVNNINISKNEHQKSNTECGLYSLFYIYNRLNKIPIQYFEYNNYDRITDETMIKFRKYVFYQNIEN